MNLRRRDLRPSGGAARKPVEGFEMPDDCDTTLHLYKDTPRGVCLVSFFDQGDTIIVDGGGTGQTRSRASFTRDERPAVETAIETLLSEGYAPIAADQVSGITRPQPAAQQQGRSTHSSTLSSTDDTLAALDIRNWIDSLF